MLAGTVMIPTTVQIALSLEKDVRDTSVEAYREILSEISKRHKEYILTLLDIGEKSTDFEVSVHAMHGDPNYFRPRRYELAGFGNTPEHPAIVKECGKRQCKITGRTVYTWYFTEYGLKIATKLRRGK